MTSAQEEKSGSSGGNGVTRTLWSELSRKQTWRPVCLKILWGASALLALAILGLAAAVTRRSGQELRAATAGVSHTREVLEKVGELSAGLNEVESSARGFALSGKQSHPDPFYTAVGAVPAQEEEVKALLRGDPAAEGVLAEIEPVISLHLNVMKKLVDQGKKNPVPKSGQRKPIDDGNTLMDEIRLTLGGLEKTQRAQLAEQETVVTARAERLRKLSVAESGLAGVLVLAFGVAGLLALNCPVKAKGRLEGEQICELNKELQNRAAELEATNKELEAFSYSVSHDLRSPLQNIDSFSQILADEYASRLDAEGRDYVQRLRASCQHMEEIIEALLALSSLGRKELALEPVELSTLAKGVAAELKQKHPERAVDWLIAEGLMVQGDALLLRVALENLLGNAWKFTQKRPRARIEFGALPRGNGAPTYFVRDDGAGFDMARADHLFAPFKRLHDQNQFRGTGIGLATVQRVIRRHGGKIWAQGQVDRGATFCFTLSDERGHSNGSDHPLPNAS